MNIQELASQFEMKFKKESVAPEDRRFAYELLVAEYVSYMQPVPPTAVENTFSYFKSNCSINVGKLLSEFTEITPIDFNKVSNLIYELWLIRYSLVHRPGSGISGLFLQCASRSLTNGLTEEHVRVLATYQNLGVPSTVDLPSAF